MILIGKFILIYFELKKHFKVLKYFGLSSVSYISLVLLAMCKNQLKVPSLYLYIPGNCLSSSLLLNKYKYQLSKQCYNWHKFNILMLQAKYWTSIKIYNASNIKEIYLFQNLNPFKISHLCQKLQVINFLYVSSSLLYSILISDDVLESEFDSNDCSGVDQVANEKSDNQEKRKLLICSNFYTYIQF